MLKKKMAAVVFIIISCFALIGCKSDNEKKADIAKDSYNKTVKNIEQKKYKEALKNINLVTKNAVFDKKKKREKINLDEQFGIYVRALYLKGDVYKAQKDEESFNKAYKSALKEDLEKRESKRVLESIDYLKRGIAQFNEKHFEEALASFEEGLAQKKVTCKQELCYNKIVTLEMLGKWDCAKKELSAYEKNYPNDTKLKEDSMFLSTR